jgi:hypothetical protein
MKLRKIRTTEIASFFFLLIYLFSWIAVPIHLQSINHLRGFDTSGSQQAEVPQSFYDEKYLERHESKPVAKPALHPEHDEGHCLICSLAHSKVFQHNTKSQINIVALEWLLPVQNELIPCYSSFIESIRGPPSSILLG